MNECSHKNTVCVSEGAVVLRCSDCGAGRSSFSSEFSYPDNRTSHSIPIRALTYDDGKEPLAVLPWAAMDELSQVQAYGHKKYKDFYNYRKGMEVSRNLSCAIRHIRDFMEGADKDHESGCHPLGHALCRIAFVLQNLKDGTAIDDRYSKRAKTK